MDGSDGGRLQESDVARYLGDSRNDAGNPCSSIGDSILGVVIVARGDSSITESSAKNELKVAMSSTIDGRKGDRLEQGTTGVSFDSS